MRPIKHFIFSKDRAPQLDYFLRSAKSNCPDDLFEFFVVYKCSDIFYERGYDVLRDRIEEDRLSGKNRYPNVYDMVKESTFKQDLVWLLEDAAKTDYLWALSTDDCVVFDQLPSNSLEIIRGAFDDPECLTFSLRLGLNTTVTNYYTGEGHKPIGATRHGPTISWDYRDHSPFSALGYFPYCDGFVGRVEPILRMVKGIPFHNLRGYEGHLALPHNRMVWPQNRFYSFPLSKLVSLSINESVGDGCCVSGKYYPLSLEGANARYINGETLAFRIDPATVRSCHAEFEPIWTREE